MVTTTFDVTERLAARLSPLGEQKPELLAWILELLPAKVRSEDFALLFKYAVFEETMDFLAAAPTPGQIIEFKASAPVQDRLDDLLEKNREQWLSEEEAAELNAYAQIGHLMLRLKARARMMKQSTSPAR